MLGACSQWISTEIPRKIHFQPGVLQAVHLPINCKGRVKIFWDRRRQKNMYFPQPLSWDTPGSRVLAKEGSKPKRENRGLKSETEPRSQDKGFPRWRHTKSWLAEPGQSANDLPCRAEGARAPESTRKQMDYRIEPNIWKVIANLQSRFDGTHRKTVKAKCWLNLFI